MGPSSAPQNWPKSIAPLSTGQCGQSQTSRPQSRKHRVIGKEPYKDTLTQEVYRQAVEGIDEPVYYQGKLVDTVKKYSPILLMFLLKREDPSYRDSYRAPEDDSGKVSLVDVIAAVQQAAH